MKLKVDEKSDALYFRLNEAAIVDSEEVQPGITLDYDKKGRVVGIEILGIKSRTKAASLRELIFQTV